MRFNRCDVTGRRASLGCQKCREESMGRKIAIVGAGAVGGYAGAHMVQAGEDVTFIDPWPEHVEHMRKHGLRVTHARDVAEFSVPVRALHVTNAQQLAKETPGHIHRGAGKGGAAHTVFRAGEVHGRITQRAEEICRLVGYADSAKVTGNLWGERWSKLVANAMGNGLSACTGLPGGQMLQSEPIRRFSTRLGSEAIRVGQAHGYQLEEILHLPPETIARAGEGDEAAMHACDEQRFKDGKKTASEQRPSMGQDMQKGRRTEIEFLNGFVVREGGKVGLSCSANAVLTDIVKRVERNELSPDPRHITELRLN